MAIIHLFPPFLRICKTTGPNVYTNFSGRKVPSQIEMQCLNNVKLTATSSTLETVCSNKDSAGHGSMSSSPRQKHRRKTIATIVAHDGISPNLDIGFTDDETVSNFSASDVKKTPLIPKPDLRASSHVTFEVNDGSCGKETQLNSKLYDEILAAPEKQDDVVSAKSFSSGESGVSLDNTAYAVHSTADITFPSRTTTVLAISTAQTVSSTDSRLKLRHVQSVNERRRHFEDNLAAIFMAFVLVFLICHMPRLLLNIHELITIKEAMLCSQRNERPFSLWSMITISVSHFLLVINSSTNILVYCLMSSKFREECRSIFRTIVADCGTIGQCCDLKIPSTNSSRNSLTTRGESIVNLPNESTCRFISTKI